MSLAYHDAAIGTSGGIQDTRARRLPRRAVAARRRPADTEDALSRLADGGIGRCEQCRSPIPDVLLTAAPESRYRTSCAAGAAGGDPRASAAGDDELVTAFPSLPAGSAASCPATLIIPAPDAIFPALDRPGRG